MGIREVLDRCCSHKLWIGKILARHFKWSCPQVTDNAAEPRSMKTEYWPQILVGRFESNCSRTMKGKKLERRLITDIIFCCWMFAYQVSQIELKPFCRWIYETHRLLWIRFCFAFSLPKTL